MKLPSIQQLARDAGRTIIRFPVLHIDAALGTIAAISLIDAKEPANASILYNIMFAAILGFPLLLAFALIAEKKKWQRLPSLSLQLLGIVLLVLYALSVPSSIPSAPAIHIIRLLILAIGLIFFVSIAPFLGKNEVNGFWHYNKTLFLCLFTAAIYALVLFAGLAFALAAMENLFGMDIPEKRYGELLVLIVGLFYTWFFLAGVPKDLDALEQSSDYPKRLKIFTQYILSPLVLVYLVILYAYLLKILIDWAWPVGWVSKLILGFSATGLFSLLLLYPIRELKGNKWIRIVWRWFFLLLIPFLIMLPLAVWRRISQYGITEGRYLAMAFGAWLVLMALYFLFSKTKNIKVISATLCLLAVLVCYGDWSVFSVSAKSQAGRLEELLSKNSILVDGKVQKVGTQPGKEDSRQISSILAYLHDIHGYRRIQPWFQANLQQDSTGKTAAGKNPAEVAGLLGVEYMQGWMSKGGKDIQLRDSQYGVTNIQGYDYSLRAFNFNKEHMRIDFAPEKISCQFNTKLDTLTFSYRPEGMAADSLQIGLHPFLEQLVLEYSETNPQNIPSEKMSKSAENQKMKVKVCLRFINLQREGTIFFPTSLTAQIFYSLSK